MAPLSFGHYYGRTVASVRTDFFAFDQQSGRPAAGVPRHTHEDPHFCLVLQGAYDTRTRNLAGGCPPLTLLYHPAGTTHDDQFLDPRGTALMVSTRRLTWERLDPPTLGLDSIAFDEAELGFPGLRMYRELLLADSASPLTLEALALEMIGAAARRREPMERRRPRWLGRALELIRAHARDPVKVADIAAGVGVHPVSLARGFRRHLGVSPGDVLRRARLRYAIDRLLVTADGIADIAADAGFCDQADLTKALRREVGTTPAALRRHHRERAS